MMHLKAIVGLVCMGFVLADVRDIASHHKSSISKSVDPSASHAFSTERKIGFGSNEDSTFHLKLLNAGNAQSNSNNNKDNRKRYWWMETGSSPFTSQYNTFDGSSSESSSNEYNTRQQPNNNQNSKLRQSNYHFDSNDSEFQCFSAWCRSDSSKPNPKQNTQQHQPNQQQNHNTFKRNHYSQNPFLANQVPRQSNNIYTHTSLSGSPSEVNSLLVSQTSQTSPFGSTHTSNSLTTGTFASGNIPCTTPGNVCAPKHVCNNGYIAESQLPLISSQSDVSIAFLSY